MATCAVCQQPIANLTRMRVAGSEILHVACARSGQQTIGARRQQDIARLEAELATERRRRHEAELEVGRARNALRKVESSVAIDEQRHADELAQLAGARDRALADAARARGEAAAATRQADEAIRERDAAVADAARPATAEHTSGDDASVRFSLLEFDRCSTD